MFEDMKPGIYEDIPYEEYAQIPAFRSHDLTAVIKCPYRWKHQKEMTQTPALLEGRVQHTVFLEHHNFDKEFVIQPNIDRRTKVGKEDYANFMTSVGERTAISRDLYAVCMERRAVVQEYVPAKDHKTELTLVFELHRHPFKCRLDWYDGERVWDLKPCRDASPRGFRNAINSFNYHMQAALYLDGCKASGLRADGFNFLAQEKAHPYPYGVYTLSDEALEYARARNEQALDLLLKCKDKDDFRPYNLDGVQVVEISDLY